MMVVPPVPHRISDFDLYHDHLKRQGVEDVAFRLGAFVVANWQPQFRNATQADFDAWIERVVRTSAVIPAASMMVVPPVPHRISDIDLYHEHLKRQGVEDVAFRLGAFAVANWQFRNATQADFDAFIERVVRTCR